VNKTNVPALPCTKGKRAPAAPATRGIRYWLADTGCPVDLVSEKTLPKATTACIEAAAVEQNFDTANDELKADRTVRMQIEGLYDDCEPYVLADTPDVISIDACDLVTVSIGIRGPRSPISHDMLIRGVVKYNW